MPLFGRARETSRRPRRSLVVGILCAGLLGACGSQSPEALVDSAKVYIADDDLNAAGIQLKNALQADSSLVEARFLLGSVYLDQGDLRGAIRELRRAAEFGYPAESVAPLLSRALLLSGEYDLVIKEFEWITLDDRRAQSNVLASVGDAHLGKGDVDRARTIFQAAIDVNPGNAIARVGLGRTKLLSGDLHGAFADAERALQVDANAAEAHALRADALAAQGKTADAIAAFDAALRQQPGAINYHLALISLLLAEDDLDGIERRLVALNRLAPRHPQTRYLKAFVAMRRDRLAEARDGVVEMLRLSPDHLPGQLLAGSIHFRLNDHTVAQRHLEYVLARAGDQPLARRLLVASLLATGETARANEVLRPLLETGAEDATTMTLAGQVFLAVGDFERAANFFMKAVTADPEDVQARTRLGMSKLIGGDTVGAFAELEAASRLDDALGQPEVALIVAHMRGGAFDKALEVHRTLERKRPDSFQTHNLKGGILLGKGDADGARAAFERALALSPDSLATVVNLARLDLTQDRTADARRRFDEIIASQPRNMDAYLALANLMMQTGAAPGEVRGVLERALEADPAAAAPKIALVRFHLDRGESKRALSLAQEVSAANPEDPRALDVLAQAQSATGSHQQAVGTLSTLVRLRPQSSESLVALADAQRQVGDKAGAERSLRHALRIRPDALEAKQRLIPLAVERGRITEALTLSRDIQSRLPGAMTGFVMEGDVFVSASNWAEAVPAYRSALERGAGPDVAVKLHAAQMRAGLKADAGKTATDWLSVYPDDLVMRGYLAERALMERRLEDAENIYRRMLGIRPDNALILNNLAWVSGQLGRVDAIALAERAVALAPDNAGVLDTLGVLQIKGGDHEMGLRNLRRAVELAPDVAALRLNLAKAYMTLERDDDARKELEEVIKHAPEGSPMHDEASRLKHGF